MKTFTKHILLLALMLFGVAGAAWATPRAPQKFTSAVNLSVLQVGDTLAEGASITFDIGSFNWSRNLGVVPNRAKKNGDPIPGTYAVEINIDFTIGAGGVIIDGSDSFTPVTQSGDDGDAWVVTYLNVEEEVIDVEISGVLLPVPAPDPYAPTLDETTGNWNFLMPGSNKVVKVTYKAEPALAWTFGNRAIPNDTTITAYRGFELPVIGSIGAIMDHDFLTALEGGTVSLRYGSTNPAVISFTNPNNMYSFSVNGAGECDVYMVFDGNDDFQDDSVAFHAVIAEPATLTLASNNSEWGTVSVLLGSESDGNDLLGTFTGNSTTIDGIATLNPNGAEYDELTGWGIYTNNTDMTVTIAEGVNVTKVKFIGDRGSYYEDTEAPYQVTLYQYYNGFTNAPNEDVASIEVYGVPAAGSDSIVATATEGQYLVIPGTTVNVTATPDSAHYLARIDGHDTVGNYACGYSFVMPSDDKDLLAVFNEKPTLTLDQTDGGTLEAIVPEGVTFEQLTADMVPANWQGDFDTRLTEADLQDWGFMAVDKDVAAAWTGAPATGNAKLIYEFITSEGKVKLLEFYDGTTSGAPTTAWLNRGYIYNNREEFYFTSGTGTSNVIASSTPNTYIIDYGTDVTVKATPDAQHYLVSFSDDDPATELNSNIAVEKTYDSVIADIPNLSANFQAKPTLTLTANDGGTLTLDGMTEPGATGTTFTVPGTWQDDNTPLTATDFPGFVPVSQEQALNWQAPASGNYRLFYKYEGGYWYYINFNNGTLGISNYEDLYHFNIYNIQNIGRTIAYTTGAIGGMPAGVVSANATRDTFVVDYGTEVTVTATPDSIHYLATLGGVTMGSNTAKDTTFAVTATTNLAANFAQKPTLTLAHNDGGTLEAIVPEGVGEETLLTTVTATSQTTSSQSPDGIVTVTLNNIERYDSPDGWMLGGSVTVEAAQGYTITRCVFKQDLNLVDDQAPFTASIGFDGDDYYVSAATSTGVVTVDNYGISSIEVYGYQNVAPNVIASSTPNTYYIDYNTSVTVKATPSDTAYLVRFDQDADTNSNVAVEKTYGPLTAALTTAEATFNDKPVLTLAQGRALVSDDLDAWGTLTLGGDDLPAGIAQLTDNTYRVDYGTTVTVQADATELHHVANWVNEDSVAYPETAITYGRYFITEPVALFPDSSTLTLTVTADTTARALFGINSYDVSASVAESDDVRGTVAIAYTDIDGAGQTTAAGASAEATAQGGSTSTLTATATDPGYHFVGWMDNLNTQSALNTQNPLTVTEAGSYTATFDTNSYQIGGSVAEGSTEWGSVTGSGEYRHFTTATLTAMPIEHYHFVRWEDGNTQNPRIIDVTGEESHEAEFAIDRFIVEWSSNDETMGHVVGPYDNHTTGNPIPRLQGSYGTQFNLTASPAEHHMLDHWSTGQTTNVITVTITEDAEIVANFKHVPYSVSVASADETMGTVSGSQESVEWQASTEISATANYGYHFVRWNDGNTANPRTVTINEEHDYSFTALFAKNQYTVTVVTGDATRGSVSGTTTVDYLTDVEISATANEHYHFEQWEDGNMQNPRTVTVTANATYRAYFAPDKYTVTGLADQGQGSVTGSGSYAYLSNAMLTAEPACGYLFDHWSNESTESTITFQVTGEMSYTAFFRPAVVDTVEVHDTTVVTNTVTVHDTTYIDIHDSIDVTVHVHDTTIVEVPVYVHDTTTVTVTEYVHDTTTVTVTEYVHDTTVVNVPVHDTVYVSDGTIIYVHDTTTVEVPVNVYVHDTTTVEVQVPVYVHDTTTIEVQVPVYVHDTTTIEVQVPVYVYDTTTVYDTTVVEVPVHDTTTVTEYEYIHDTVEVTVIVHDTIFIHDTIFVGIEGVDALDAKIYGNNGQIVVEGADFNEVILFDVNGRILARRQDEGLPLRFDIPASGAYLVKIGNHAARRIVMIR